MAVNYSEYLLSDAWRAVSDKVRRRAGGRCERCKKNPISDVHHLTYDRLGHERLTDLIALCRLCHKAVHRIQGSDVFAHEERRLQDSFRYTGKRTK